MYKDRMGTRIMIQQKNYAKYDYGYDDGRIEQDRTGGVSKIGRKLDRGGSVRQVTWTTQYTVFSIT